MTQDTAVCTNASLLDSSITVPQHVVYRSFPNETVMLNLNTGKYHGLNATAGQMLEVLEGRSSVREAVNALAGTYGQPREVLERDICEFCQSLAERGLIEVSGGG